VKYRLTPLNIFCAILVGIEIMSFIFPQFLQNQHYGYQHIYLIPVIVIGLLIDFIIQKVIRQYTWILLLEIILIVATVLLNVKFW